MASTEYANAGVDPTKIDTFKEIMKATGQKTMDLPRRRGIIVEAAEHGATVEYLGPGTFKICNVIEGLGNKNWVAEWMYQATKKPYYHGIGIDTALMPVNDALAQGALPGSFADLVEAGDSEWFEDSVRAQDFANGFYDVCKEVGMALAAGESASLRYLVKSEPPVKSAPSLSGSVIAIIAPREREIKNRIQSGDQMIGFASSGGHANGISLMIQEALKLPDQFLTKLPNGNTLGEEILIPTRSYVRLMEEMLKQEVVIHGALPMTGDGVAKLAFSKGELTYRVTDWPSENVRPPLFAYLEHGLGLSQATMLGTFNYGIGWVLFVPKPAVDTVMHIGRHQGYFPMHLGFVEEGRRGTIFGPAGDLWLKPPGEK